MAEDRQFAGTFGDDALRYAATPGQTGNALTRLLREWLGPRAGRFGHTHEVVLNRTGELWGMRPADRVGVTAPSADRVVSITRDRN